MPEPSATSQGEWLCPAATVGRDRRHSERNNPGQDPAQPSPAPGGAGGARRCGWEEGSGGGLQTHCLDLWALECAGGEAGYVNKDQGDQLSWALVPPESQLRVPSIIPLIRSCSHQDTAELAVWVQGCIPGADPMIFWNRPSGSQGKNNSTTSARLLCS